MQLVVAFKFRLLRKVFYYAWNLQDDVSKITFESGSKDCPIWLDHENISLDDIETITTLLNHKEYTSIESISTEKMDRLDHAVKTLRLDRDSHIYYERTRLLNTQPHTIRATLYTHQFETYEDKEYF
jgi:hypothetical protein